MKVCHLTNVHNNTDGRIFRKECKSLADAGFETYLVGPGASREEFGVTVVGVNKANNRFERILKTAREVYKKGLSLDADVYHLHDPELIPWGVKLAKREKKVIFDSHENYLDMIKDKEWIPAPLRVPISMLFNMFFKRAMKRFSAVIIVSPYPDNRMERYCDIVEVISNYPDVSDYPKKKNLPKNMMFAGGINEQWNHVVVLDALAEFEDVTYTLCGPVGESYLNLLKSHESWNKVDYRGVIPFDEVQTLLKDAGVGLALLEPSDNTFGEWGTLGNTKLFEEMSVGLPVICTDFVLWRQIEEEYRSCICVRPHDKDAIVGALKQLFDDEAAALDMGRRGQKAVREKYAWSSEAKKLVSLYRSLED